MDYETYGINKAKSHIKWLVMKETIHSNMMFNDEGDSFDIAYLKSIQEILNNLNNLLK